MKFIGTNKKQLVIEVISLKAALLRNKHNLSACSLLPAIVTDQYKVHTTTYFPAFIIFSIPYSLATQCSCLVYQPSVEFSDLNYCIIYQSANSDRATITRRYRVWKNLYFFICAGPFCSTTAK